MNNLREIWKELPNNSQQIVRQIEQLCKTNQFKKLFTQSWPKMSRQMNWKTQDDLKDYAGLQLVRRAAQLCTYSIHQQNKKQFLTNGVQAFKKYISKEHYELISSMINKWNDFMNIVRECTRIPLIQSNEEIQPLVKPQIDKKYFSTEEVALLKQMTERIQQASESFETWQSKQLVRMKAKLQDLMAQNTFIKAKLGSLFIEFGSNQSIQYNQKQSEFKAHLDAFSEQLRQQQNTNKQRIEKTRQISSFLLSVKKSIKNEVGLNLSTETDESILSTEKIEYHDKYLQQFLSLIMTMLKKQAQKRGQMTTIRQQLESQCQRMKQETTQLQSQLNQKSQLFEKHQQLLEIRQKQMIDLNLRFEKVNEHTTKVQKTLEDQKRLLEQNKATFMQQIKELQKEIATCKEEKNKTEEKLSLAKQETIEKIAQKNQELQELKRKQGQLASQTEQTISELRLNSQRLEVSQKKWKQACDLLREEAQIMSQKIAELQTQLTSSMKCMQSLQEQIKILSQQKEQLEELITKERKIPKNMLFTDEILKDRPEDQYFLADTLSNRYKKRVTFSKLLCKLDPLNKTNFHKYIDGIPHILVVVQLKNGGILAAFSLSPFISGSKGDDSLIISVTQRQVFFLKPEARAITYDDFYLIVGNSEFRLKTGESQIFSNFAIGNSFFDCRGLTVDSLLGQGKNVRQVDLIGYQIYQVFFQQPNYV